MQYLVTARNLSVQSWGKFVKKVKRPQKGRVFIFLNGPGLTDKLLSIKPDLDPVVEESKEGGEGEGGNEDGDEAELENHLEVLLEQALVANEPIVRLDLRLNLASLFQLLLVPPGLQLGNDDLLGVVDALLPHHDHSKLLGKLNQATTCLIGFKDATGRKV